MSGPLRQWIDGAPLAGAPHVGADDSAFREGRGCYTSALAERGRVRHLTRHAARLRRDAARIGLGELDEALCRRALLELAEAAASDGARVVRLQASRAADGALHLVGTARPLGADPAAWQALRAPFPHQGPAPWMGAKVTSRLRFALAGDLARAAGAQEAILLDATEHLVEGARTNLVVVDAAGVARTPPLARGGVAGIAREILLERLTELREEDVRLAVLHGARELVAVNAVRGARPVVVLDERSVGDGRPGPWCARLASVLESD